MPPCAQSGSEAISNTFVESKIRWLSVSWHVEEPVGCSSSSPLCCSKTPFLWEMCESSDFGLSFFVRYQSFNVLPTRGHICFQLGMLSTQPWASNCNQELPLGYSKVTPEEKKNIAFRDEILRVYSVFQKKDSPKWNITPSASLVILSANWVNLFLTEEFYEMTSVCVLPLENALGFLHIEK